MEAAIITGCITMIGWIVSYYLTKQKENSTKRLQLQIEYVSRQIEEFYGPVFSLINQLDMYYITKTKIVDNSGIASNDKVRIDVFVRESYFYQLHSEIRHLIKTKFHLLEESELPDSYKLYLQHSIQETLQIEIWNKLNINTVCVKGLEWPNEFDKHIERELNSLKAKYDMLINKLR